MAIQVLAVWASSETNTARYARVVHWDGEYRCVFVSTLGRHEPPFNWEERVRLFPSYPMATHAAVAWVTEGTLPPGALLQTESGAP